MWPYSGPCVNARCFVHRSAHSITGVVKQSYTKRDIGVINIKFCKTLNGSTNWNRAFQLPNLGFGEFCKLPDVITNLSRMIQVASNFLIAITSTTFREFPAWTSMWNFTCNTKNIQRIKIPIFHTWNYFETINSKT